MAITAADRPWLGHYPPGMPAAIDASQYRSLVDLLENSFSQYAGRKACSFMGCDFSYAELERRSRELAACFQRETPSATALRRHSGLAGQNTSIILALAAAEAPSTGPFAFHSKFSFLSASSTLPEL